MYASLFRRIVATLVDIGVVVLTIYFVQQRLVDEAALVKIMLAAAVVILYEPLLTVCACTIGQLVMGTRVRHSETRKRISSRMAYARFAAKYAGTLAGARHSRRKDLRMNHDLVADTVVVNAGAA